MKESATQNLWRERAGEQGPSKGRLEVGHPHAPALGPAGSGGTGRRFRIQPAGRKITKGIIGGLVPLATLDGSETDVTAISRKSCEVDGACRSRGTAEAMVTVDGEDDLRGIKTQWLEMPGIKIDWRDPDVVLRGPPGALVTDWKGLCKKLQTAARSPKGKETRTDVEDGAARRRRLI